MSRRAKIVCTIGPATPDAGSVRRLVECGMDVARLNLSHGTHDDHARHYEWVRRAGDETGRAVAVLADLQGPKIRLGTFIGGRAIWTAGIASSSPPTTSPERLSGYRPRIPGSTTTSALVTPSSSTTGTWRSRWSPWTPPM